MSVTSLPAAMDDFTAELLASGQDFDSPRTPEQSRDIDESPRSDPDPDRPVTPPHRTGLRGGIAAIREKASLQDRLVEKFVASAPWLRCISRARY